MLLGAARRLVRKSILKMSSDLISPGEPNTFLCFGVLDELSQSRQSRRSPNDAAMQPDGHHLGRAVQTLLVQLIKGGDEVLGKVIRGDECLTSYVFVVVAIKRLRRSEAHARSEIPSNRKEVDSLRVLLFWLLKEPRVLVCQHARAVAVFTAPHEGRAAPHLCGALNSLQRYNRGARAGRNRYIAHCAKCVRVSQ
jgi:hypothetical protein